MGNQMKNQIFITFDSLRWDTFQSANLPFLRSLGQWHRAYAQGTYTLPAHMSFFMGKLPQTLDQSDFYDTAAIRYEAEKRAERPLQAWRLDNPEAPRPAKHVLQGENIISGFRSKGYYTVGTGAVNWFNPKLPAARYLTEPFQDFRFFDGNDLAHHESVEEQIDWILSRLAANKEPYFLFMNLGETHHRFVYKNCGWHDDGDPYGDAQKCKSRQQKCIEYLDQNLEKLFSNLKNYDLVMCSDHGEVLGEDNLWGHGFYHEKVLEVPLLIKQEAA